MRTRLSPPVFAAVLAIAAALSAAFSLSPNVDADTWWHLRVGQLIHDNGAVPHTDPFSRLGLERPTPWIAYSWLYELGLYETYVVGGLTGVMLVRTALCALSAAAVLGFAARRVRPTAVGAVVVLLAAVVLMPFARERPWHVSMAFTVLTLAAVTRGREGEWSNRIWWLPVAFAVWANAHIQFVLGWLVLGLACVFPGRADRRRLMLLTAVCVLATLLNPYHIRLLGVVWDYATQTGPLRSVRELAPPEWDSVWTWAAFALLGWSALRVVRRRPVDGFAVALLLAGVMLSLRMRRDLWFGVVVAVAVWRDVGVELTPPLRKFVAPAVVLVAFAVARLLHLTGVGPSSDFLAAEAAAFPRDAVAFIRERDLPGPLFNPFDWGGYLIWALPEHPVSIDGRTNLYGSERVGRSMDTWIGGEGWDADPDLNTARLVVAPVGSPLARLLRERPDEWAVAFEDATAVVLTARTR